MPSHTPLQPNTPPLTLTPKPPSYGPVGGGVKRRPLYGTLDAADWKGGATPGFRVSKTQHSNSGDWDGLVTAITTTVTKPREEAEEVDDDMASWEETSWEDAQFNAAMLGFSNPANYDSSYDSQSSYGSDRMAEEMANLALPESIMPAAIQDKVPIGVVAQPALVGSGAVGGNTPAGPTPSQPSTPSKIKTTTEEAVGLEFAAGVHLIEEMEKQVAQWEETETSRQQAYTAFVQSQMMLRAQQRQHGVAR